MIQSLPRHLYAFVDSELIYQQPCGLVPCVWFGLVGVPGRAWGLNVMLESGAVYRNIPPHGIAFTQKAAKWKLKQAQHWDCYSATFQLHEYDYLAGLRCRVNVAGSDWLRGRYLFTLFPYSDGFSAEPEQAKEHKFVQLDNGRLAIVPTNKIVFSDDSFTVPGFNRLKTQKTVWRVE